MKSFIEIFEKIRQDSVLPTMGVVCANDIFSLESALKVMEEGIVRPVLIGKEAEIRRFLKENGEDGTLEIVSISDPEEASAYAVHGVRKGEFQLLMKGQLDTKTLLKAVVDKEKGIGTGRLMTHIALINLPSYHKLLAVTDGGMLPYPDFSQKKGILENAVDFFHRLGVAQPKVAVLCAVEKENPKMPETIDAAKLKEMNRDGWLPECIVEGPISFDLAFSKKAADIKQYESEVAGDADVLLVPDIVTGNVLAKSFTYAAGGIFSGIIYGAEVPVVLTSRGADLDEKLHSIALAAALGDTR